MKRISLLALIPAIAGAQVYTPPTGGGAPAPQNNSDVSPAPKKAAPTSPFGQEIPLLDMSAETITVGGVAIPLGDNRLLRARFEKYLSQPPETDEAAQEYRVNMETILGEISPFATGGPDLQAAFKLLPRASTYPGDANLCLTLAESVYTALLAKKDVKSLSTMNLSMEKEKEEIMRRADWAARTEENPGLRRTRQTGGDDGEGKGE